MDFREPEERRSLREAVAALGARYGRGWYTEQARSGKSSDELWDEAARLGYLGVSVPEEYGGGGGGMGDLAAVCEELSAAGCPLLLILVSPAICATVIARYGTDEQRQRWLPGFADGSVRMAFAITEPDAGSNSHRLTTTAKPKGDGWLLNGRKTFISGVDGADAVMVVGRMHDSRTGKLKPALFIVPTDAAGFTWHRIEMDFNSPDRQFQLFIDDVELSAEALVGGPEAGLAPLFAGLNPERIMAASQALGLGRYALARAADYARTRTVWDAPIGAHQGLAHPMAAAAVSLESARLLTQKAAWLYDTGGPSDAAGEAANMAKYAAAEAASAAVDIAVQVHGGNAFASEYGIGPLLAAARLSRIAPVSREMVLNFVAQHTLGLPRSY